MLRPPRTRAADLGGLIAWVALTAIAAAAGSIASIDASEFYRALDRPSWSPPGAVFGPVWTTLYTMMAIAAWLVWRERGLAGSTALALYVFQLGVNALWSWLFFRWRLGAWAFVDVVLLVVAVGATAAAFRRVRPLAALLLLPYLAWVTFATALTLAVWRRNPGAL